MSRLEVRPLTAERWPDLERLFGPKGACAGCWCTWWKLRRSEWTAGKGEGNRRRQEAWVRGGIVPGLLAYVDGIPVGWIAVEPREAYPALGRSRTLAAVDDTPVWSITCLYVARAHRRKGLSRALVLAATRHARAAGARAVEAYPVDYRGEVADAWVYTGAASTFRDLGFAEAARRSKSRPIVRKVLRAVPRGRAPRAATRGPVRAAGRARR